MPPEQSNQYSQHEFIVQNLIVRYPHIMAAEIRENVYSCAKCCKPLLSTLASYCQNCGTYLRKQNRSFLDNSSLGKNSWWIWVVFTIIFVVVWQVIGSLPLVGFCGILNVVNLGSYTCDLETLVIAGNSKAPNFLLMHITFVVGAASFYILLKILHGKNLLQVLTKRLQFDYKRSLFALLVFFLLGGISLIANLMSGSSDLKFRGDIPDLLVITIMALVLVPVQAGLEEAFFRGYLIQGFSLLIKSRLAILIVTSSIFASLHLMNPEPWSYGILPYVVSVFLVGLFMGLITLFDGGVELAVGVHIANNLWVHLIVGLEKSIIPSSSLFIADQESLELVSTVIPSLIQYGILTVIFALKYKWFQKLKEYTAP